MKSFFRLSTSQRLRLMVGLGMVVYGMYHLVRYALGYSVTFGVPGTSLQGAGSKVAGVYLIIVAIGAAAFRPVYERMRASGTEA